MIDGILLIDKEVGITSYDVIRKLKKVLEKGQKIGHAGTLDPFASGLLVILLGRGTKLMDTFQTFKKRYVVDGIFGFSTDTQDITGEKTDTGDGHVPTLEEIQKEISKSLLGEISQQPPIFSAKRINGQRAYDLAREGKEVNIQPKLISVTEFKVLKYEYPNIKCEIECSSGTYIRTLIHDLGKNLGVCATAKELRRESIGVFTLKGSISSEDISESSLEECFVDIFKVKELIS